MARVGKKERSSASIGVGLALAGLLLASACSGSPDLVVDLRTDFLPGFEFTTVETRFSGGATSTISATRDQDYITGLRVAEYDDLPVGDAVVEVRLLDASGTELASRSTEFTFETTSVGLTVVIDRGCLGVSCPAPEDAPMETECRGGRCVTPRCHPGNQAECGAGLCDDDVECTMGGGCGRGVCVAEACLYRADDGACEATQRCDERLMCVRDAPPDTGPADTGPADTGPADTGPADTGGSSEDCNAEDDDGDGQIDEAAGCPCPVSQSDEYVYLFCRTELDWDAARDLCLSVAYDLATIGDSDENDFILAETSGAVSDEEEWWIGLNDAASEGTFVWADGDASSYRNWDTAEPDGGTRDACVDTNANDGTWGDSICSREQFFVCSARL